MSKLEHSKAPLPNAPASSLATPTSAAVYIIFPHALNFLFFFFTSVEANNLIEAPLRRLAEGCLSFGSYGLSSVPGLVD